MAVSMVRHASSFVLKFSQILDFWHCGSILQELFLCTYTVGGKAILVVLFTRLLHSELVYTMGL